MTLSRFLDGAILLALLRSLRRSLTNLSVGRASQGLLVLRSS